MQAAETLQEFYEDVGIPEDVWAWAKGFNQDNSVFSMIRVIGLIPQFRKPEKISEGVITKGLVFLYQNTLRLTNYPKAWESFTALLGLNTL